MVEHVRELCREREDPLEMKVTAYVSRLYGLKKEFAHEPTPDEWRVIKWLQDQLLIAVKKHSTKGLDYFVIHHLNAMDREKRHHLACNLCGKIASKGEQLRDHIDSHRTKPLRFYGRVPSYVAHERVCPVCGFRTSNGTETIARHLYEVHDPHELWPHGLQKGSRVMTWLFTECHSRGPAHAKLDMRTINHLNGLNCRRRRIG